MKLADNLAILFWLRKSAKKSNGKIPLYCRITYEQKRAVFSTGILLLQSRFNQEFECLKGSGKETQIINAQLQDIRNKLRKLIIDLSQSGQPITADLIRKQYLGKKIENKTLLEAFAWHNKVFLQKVRTGNRANASLVKFTTTRDKLQAYIKYTYKTNDIPLSSIKADFAEDFEHYLQTVDNLAHNTVMKYIRNLKKILRMCVQKEWVTKNPIDGFKCSYHNPDRKILLKEDLERLISAPIHNKRLEEVRDCFVFMCYTGFAFQDAANLRSEDIQLKIDGKRWLVKPRVKTGNNETVPILPIPGALIDKYKSHPYCVANNRLLPFNSNQKMNAYLKEVGALCNINFELTTHLARHTFATTITLSNGVPLETVQVLLGHNSIKTTQIYAKVLAQKVSKDMDMLAEKLNLVISKKSLPKQKKSV